MINIDDLDDQILRKNTEVLKGVTNRHIARAKKGKDVWNKWANEIIEAVEDDTEKLLVISFDGLSIEDQIDFSGFIFPGKVSFRKTHFSKITKFSNTQFQGGVDFSYAAFSSQVSFSRVVIKGDLICQNTKFGGYTSFAHLNISGNVLLNDIEVEGGFNFVNSKVIDGEFSCANVVFPDSGNFTLSEFHGFTSFHGSCFKKSANFKRTKFLHTAKFNQTKFQGAAQFKQVIFSGSTNFVNSTFEGTIDFDFTIFEEHVPDFNFSEFTQPPSIVDVWIPSVLDIKHRSNLVKPYRMLKAISIKANDFENELKFFANETHAKYYSRGTAWPRKFFIKAYFFLSDFGRSVLRPLAFIILFLFLMNGLNRAFIEPNSKECVENSRYFKSQVYAYTLSKALPILRFDAEQTDIIKACLFGEKPLWVSHNIWGLLHLLPTSFLLFLFGLGVRNKFKIK